MHVCSIGAVIGVLIYLFVGPEGCSDPAGAAETVPPLLYGSLFAFIFVQLLAVIVENVIFSISAKGSIYNSKHERKRRWLPFWLFIRVLLFLIEIEVVIVCAVAVFGPAPYAAGALQCPEYHDGPLVFAKAVVITLFVLLAIYASGFAIFLDPLGVCHAPITIEKLKELIKNGKKDEDEEFDFEAAHPNKPIDTNPNEERARQNEPASNSSRSRSIGLGRFLAKAKRALCCLHTGGKRSKSSALREVALALYTVFSDIEDKEKRLVPSDILAGMILLSQHHKKMKKTQCSSASEGNKTCVCRQCSKKEFRRVSPIDCLQIMIIIVLIFSNQQCLRNNRNTPYKCTPKKLSDFNQSVSAPDINFIQFNAKSTMEHHYFIFYRRKNCLKASSTT